MKLKFLIVLACLLTVGCDQKPRKLIFNGSVQVDRTNGMVTSISVKFPGNTDVNATLINDREDMDRMVDHLEGMLSDIKQFRMNFPRQEHPSSVAEPVPPPVETPKSEEPPTIITRPPG